MNLHQIFSHVPAPIMAKVAANAEKERLRRDYEIKADKRKADEAYQIARTFALGLTDEQKLHLAGAMVDAADFDLPDLKAELEGALSDALAAVRGEG